MRRLAVLTSLALALAGVVVAAQPASAQYLNGLTCDFTTVAPGATVEVSSDGFDPGSDVTVSITNGALPPGTLGAGPPGTGGFSRTVLITPAQAEGNFSATFVIPSDTPNGTYNVVATGVDSELNARSVACPLTVDAGVVPPLAVTGSETTPLIQIAIAAIAAGALFLFLARSRRTRAEDLVKA